MERNRESLSTRDLAPGDPSTSAVEDREFGGTPAQSEAPGQTPPDTADSSHATPATETRDFDASSSGDAFDSRDAVRTERSQSTAVAANGESAGMQSASDGVTALARDDQARDSEPLLDRDVGADFQRRWEAVQTRFVDEPRGAVKEADGLVATLMQQLAQGFAQEHERLEAQWSRGEDISTEDLRVVLQRYRSFFRRLLST